MNSEGIHRPSHSACNLSDPSLLLLLLVAVLQDVLDKPFATVTYTEAITLLQQSKKKFDYPVKWGLDLQSEHER